jgi:hypothetical protein
MTGYRRARALASTLGAISIAAMLAFAGPATATDSSRGDDDPAGKIASYNEETGKLTIDLARGGMVSGFVTGRTWIDDGDEGCDRKGRHARRGLHGDLCDERRFSGDGHGDHDWPDGPDGDESDLVEGAVVEDAILILKDGRALYAKVELEG